MRKPALTTLFVALLIGMLVFNGSSSRASEPHSAKRETEAARVIEHRITTAELEELKREIGIWEKDTDYSRIVDGHGTGLRPPTEEEWGEVLVNGYIVERISLGPAIQSPLSVDLTTELWFPPIGNQDGEGSCTAWAVGYYMKTFQEAKEHGWDLSGADWLGGYSGYPTPAYQDRIFSPDFIYHLVNRGIDMGSSFYDAINIVCTIGASSWKEMPYDPTDSMSWPPEEAWREAPLYRGNSSGFEYLELDTEEGLSSLRNWTASTHLAAIAIDADQYPSMTSEDLWTLDNYANPVLNHANTIVGYDDNITYVEEGESRQGAFKIANSWGEGGWESIRDGCYWISYEAMKQRIGSCMFYRDRASYEPELVAAFRVDHSRRMDCDVAIGMGSNSSPLALKSFSSLIDGGPFQFCSNDIIFDITEFGDATLSATSETFFIRARVGVPPPNSGMYEWFSDGAAYSWFRLNQTFDIPETGASLRFWSYYEIEEDWDYGYVEVHDLDTNGWSTLPGSKTVSTLPERQDNPNCPAEYEPTAYYDVGLWNAFTGFSGDLYEEEMDLTPFANHTIELYFTYWTDPYTLEHGWYVDDIEIQEIGFFDDVESGSGGWTYNGWSIATPPSPSVNGTLLSFSVENYGNYSSRSLSAKATSYDTPLVISNHRVFARAHIGDVNGDGAVNVLDLTVVSLAYGNFEGEPDFDPMADLNEDGIVDMRDLVIVARHLGENDP